MDRLRMPFETFERIIALRHTAVKIPPNFCYGQIDVPLADSYALDLLQVKQDLPAWPETLIVCSPAQRCQRLAQDLDRGPVTVDERLQELSFGVWEAQLWSDIPRAISEPWTDDVIHRSPPGGESFLDLIARVRSFMLDSALSSHHKNLLLVTHAGVIRALSHLLDGLAYHDCLNQKNDFGTYRSWDVSAVLLLGRNNLLKPL